MMKRFGILFAASVVLLSLASMAKADYTLTINITMPEPAKASYMKTRPAAGVPVFVPVKADYYLEIKGGAPGVQFAVSYTLSVSASNTNSPVVSVIGSNGLPVLPTSSSTLGEYVNFDSSGKWQRNKSLGGQCPHLYSGGNIITANGDLAGFTVISPGNVAPNPFINDGKVASKTYTITVLP